MDVNEIQTHGCKYPRIGNNRTDGRRMGQNGEDDEEDEEVRREALNGSGSGHNIGVIGRFCGWPSSRIVRVSRASGGKDRHSKVLTSRGLRDRRIRLSVLTAIQFYDLQDRLGLDQPSKAVEWLLKAAATSIDDLPPIKASLPETPKQLSDERRSSAGTEHGFESNELEIDGDPSYQHHHQQQLSKSACSSTSETSKGSGLSLSRSESRIKARERARGRAAEKEKEKESDSRVANINSISQNSFTELLSAGINNVGNHTSNPSGSNQGGGNGEANFFQKNRHWSSGPTEECFTSGLFGSSRHNNNRHSSSRFSPGQIHLGGSLPIISPFNVTGEQHPPELQHFSLVPDHLIPVAPDTGSGSDYNLNFTISNLAGFNRGTLQSNSPSLSTLPHLQRFLPLEGSNAPFFISSTAQMTAPVENHQQFPASLDDRLHLYYRDPDQKGKGKN